MVHRSDKLDFLDGRWDMEQRNASIWISVIGSVYFACVLWCIFIVAVCQYLVGLVIKAPFYVKRRFRSRIDPKFCLDLDKWSFTRCADHTD